MNEPEQDSNEPLSIDATDPRQCLSDLVDGEADDQAQQRALAHWANDAEGRAAWHAYQLIGDVLRSEDLASTPRHDAAFLAALRGRLTDEPAVLAPRPVASTVRRRRRLAWAAPMAVAAGFVAVAGVLVVLQIGAPDPSDPTLAGVPEAQPGIVRVVELPEGQMLRDARIDDYLRAHRSTLAGSPAALPGGGMRNVDMTLTPR